jgi:hypothetical protein
LPAVTRVVGAPMLATLFAAASAEPAAAAGPADDHQRATAAIEQFQQRLADAGWAPEVPDPENGGA